MKILYVTNIPSPYRIEFWNQLGKKIDLTVWFEASNESNREWEINGLGDHFKFKFLKGITLGINMHINKIPFKELKEDKFDICVLGCYSTPTEMLLIQWLKMNKIPFILNSDGGFIKNENRLKANLKRYFISSANYWLSSGKNCTKYLTYYGAKEDLINEYSFSSITEYDMCRFLKNNREKKIKDNITILSIGRFVKEKGFDKLIESFAIILQKYHNVKLIIIGGGPEKDNYIELTKKLGIFDEVIIMDYIQKKYLDKYWLESDIFVFPTEEDVWGLVLNEAIAAGLPIVTSLKSGAAYDLVKDGDNGFLVNFKSKQEEIRAWAACCIELIKSEEMRLNFSSKSREIAKNYTVELMVEHHLEVFNKFRNNFLEKG